MNLMNKYIKKPLYRKANTKAKGYRYNVGKEGSKFKYTRHSKKDNRENVFGSMSGKKRGLDYTPLYMFLLSKVGKKWDDVYREAKSRLDKTEPIFYMVYRKGEIPREDCVRIGESSYYSTLFIDDEGLLQKGNSEYQPTEMSKYWKIGNKPCGRGETWTFNGKTIYNAK